MTPEQARAQADQLAAEGRQLTATLEDCLLRARGFQNAHNAALTNGDTVPGDPADQVEDVLQVIRERTEGVAA